MARDLVTTVLELVGALVVTVGAWQTFHPFGVIAAGGFSIAAGYLLADGGEA
jgi:hypothetical protein